MPQSSRGYQLQSMISVACGFVYRLSSSNDNMGYNAARRTCRGRCRERSMLKTLRRLFVTEGSRRPSRCRPTARSRLPTCCAAAGSSSGTSPRSSSGPCGSWAPRRWCARASRTAACCRPACSCPAPARPTCWRSPSAPSSPRSPTGRSFAANGMPLKLAVNVPVSALVNLPIADIVREHAADGRELARPDPRSDRGRDHPRPQARQRRRRAAAGRALLARARRFRRRLFLDRAAASSCRSASSRSTAPM